MQNLISVRSLRVVGAAALTTILAVGLIAWNILPAAAAVTGILSPSSNAGDGSTSWSSPTSAYSNGSGSATNNPNDDRHRFGGFGVSIPAGSTVNGITVYADAWDNGGGGCRLDVDLSWNGGTSWTSEKQNSLGGSEALETYGSGSDTWGHAWTPAELASVLVRVQAADGGGSCDAFGSSQDTISLDWLRLEVTYTLPQADLTVAKTNSTGGNGQTGVAFNWVSTITNGGNATASFANGNTIFVDQLPTTGATYGSPSVVLGGGTTGTVNCSVSSNTLTCTASGAVSVPVSGTIAVTLPTTPTVAGTLTNPRSGGTCAVDTGTVVTESNESNNACANNSVTVVVGSAGNPALSGSCGLDIALALDTSTSIDNDELDDLQAAFVSFVNILLPATPTQFSLIRFDDDAALVQAFTGNAATINAAINGTDGSGFTNWEAGLNAANATFDPRPDKQNVIIFASDGNPTASDGALSDLQDAMVVANAIKGQGTRIITLGIGADVSQANLEAISSADAYYNAANFATLGTALETIAEDICGGTVTVTKVIDADGNINTTNDRTPASGWTFTTNVDAPDFSTPASGATDASGLVSFAIDLGANDSANLDVSETLQAGYTALGASCVADNQAIGTAGTDAVNNITLSTNDIVTCTFINTQVGKIVVDKVTVPAADPQSFSFDASGGSYADFALTDAAAPNEQTLPSGNYSLVETVPAGWTQSNASCVSSLGDTETLGALELDPGETITCTVTNTKKGSITVAKQTLPDGDTTDFSFTGDVAATLSDGETATPVFVDPGTYTSTEGALTGWDLSGISCSDGNSTFDLGTRTATFQVEAGENVTCTFLNTKRGTITVVKDAIGGDGEFDFTTSYGAPFALSDGEQDVSATLAPGNYSVSEAAEEGWDLTSATCSDGSPIDTISVGAGEDITCTFTNTKRGSITVKKNVLNPDGGEVVDTHGFTVLLDGADGKPLAEGTDAFYGNVAPGSYTLTEGADANYDLSAATPVTVNPGEDVVVTLTNKQKKATLTVVKNLIKNNGGTAVNENFAFEVNGDDQPFEADGTNVLSVNPGSYSVTELPFLGYTASYANSLNANLDCTDLVLGSNGSATCTITNDDQPGTLIVKKTVVNDNGGTAEADDFSFKIDNGAATAFEADGQNDITIDAGTYDITEVPVFGYAAGYANCTDVVVSNGGTATCTITNDDIAPKLTVIKHVINDNGGLADADDFSLIVNSPSANPAGQFAGSEAGTVVTLKGGELYGVAESIAPGYGEPTYSEFCAGTLFVGEEKTCTVTNDDDPGTLVVKKVVVGIDPAPASAFTFSVNGAPAVAFEGDAQNDLTVDAGTYSVVETENADYVTTYDNCSNVEVAIGETETCTVTNTKKGSITVKKNVLNPDGDEVADAHSFTVLVNGINGSPIAEGTDASYTNLAPGSYTLTEVADGDYVMADPIIVELLPGENETVTFVNKQKKATITVYKDVVAPNGDPISDSHVFQATVDGVTKDISEGNPATFTVNPGTYPITENDDDDYTEGTVTDVTVGSNGADGRTFVNYQQNATITVVKNLIVDDGGDETFDDFSFTVNGGDPIFFDEDGSVEVTATPGTEYDIEEVFFEGYTQSASLSCSDIILGSNGEATCTITNDDIRPLLTVTKVVVNAGGSAVVSDFDLFVDATEVVSGEQNGFDVGSYTVSEAENADYTSVISGDCDENGTITLAPGAVKACTITNTEKPAKVIVTKTVDNNGGDAEASDFAPFKVGETTVVLGEETVMNSGTYQVSELVSEDYTVSYGGNCTSTGLITLTPGETVTCEITNTEKPSGLIVNKIVINDNGGDLDDGEVSLFVDGGSVTDEAENFFDSGSHTVSETAVPGYTATFGGDCDENGNVTLTPGETKTCTLTNDDVAPTLTVVKTVVNDNGGDDEVEDFPLFVNGNAVISGEENALSANVLYTVTETESAGYAAGSWGGDCAEDGTITLLPGDEKTCTITNDDIAPTVTLVKSVITDNGGSLGINSFGLTIGGTAVLSGEVLEVEANEAIALNEAGAPGYSFVSLTGDEKCPEVLGGTLTLDEGEDVTCIITNDDQQGTLIVKKVLTQDNGGTDLVSDFLFAVNGGSLQAFDADGQNEIAVNAGSYTVVEDDFFGYTTSYENCSSVLIGNGETKTCTITNNDIAPKLKLQKVVVGGPLTANKWNLKATGPTTISANGGVDSQNALPDGSFMAGTYALTESSTNPGAVHYTTDGVWSCIGTGNEITLAIGDEVECEITNTYVPPGTIVVAKETVPDGAEENFQFASTFTAPFTLSDGQATTTAGLIPGTYSVTESELENWDTDVICSDGSEADAIDLQSGETVTCTFTNTRHTGTIEVVKAWEGTPGTATVAIGTTAGEDDVDTALADGAGATTGANELPTGTYYVSESGDFENYNATLSCADGEGEVAVGANNSIALTKDQNVICTFTNARKEGTITVTKIVEGSDEPVSSFPLFVGEIQVVSGEANSFETGTYEVSEDGIPGFVPTFSGDCSPSPDNEARIDQIEDWLVKKLALQAAIADNPGDPDNAAKEDQIEDIDAKIEALTASLSASITLGEGEDKECVITNTNIVPETGTLVVRKVIEGNENALPESFSFSVNGDTAVAFEQDAENELTLAPGAYEVVESAAANYDASYENCNVVLSAGETEICTITNTFLPDGTVIVQKVIVGETEATADEFDFVVNDGEPNSFEQDGENELTLPIGGYVITEPEVEGFTTTYENCEFELSGGETETCVITNTVIPEGTLIVKKVIVGETEATADEFSFLVQAGDSIYPPEAFEEDGQNDLTGLAPDTYTVTEVAAEGFTTTYQNCTDIVLEADEVETCVITNTVDDGPDCEPGYHYDEQLEECVPDEPQCEPGEVWNGEQCVPVTVTCEIGEELLANGGFEATEVTNGALWDIFASGTIGWDAAWIAPAGAPEIANVEVQENGLFGSFAAASGSQWAELDSDWGGPSSGQSGEAGGVILSQDLATVIGAEYTVAFDFAARPSTAALQNAVEVYADGELIGSVPATTDSWTDYSFAFTALEEETTVSFRYAGSPNDSLGGLLDNASVQCSAQPVDACPNDPGYQASEEECSPVVVNSCPVPDTLGDEAQEVVNEAPGSEADLQDILDTDTVYVLDVMDDQTQYQVWNAESGSTITIDSVFVNRYAGKQSVFGYYVDGDLASFVPVFKTGSIAGYESLALATDGPFEVIVPEGAATIGFAIKSFNGNTPAGDHATENALNANGDDHVVVYNPASNTYVLGFEDVVDGDQDFNDLVVDLTLSCEELCEGETVIEEYVSDSTTTAGGNASVALEFIHDAWDAVIAGATWIWSEEPLTDPEGDTFETFQKSFTIDGTPTGATLEIAADNSYEVFVNGGETPVCADPTETNYDAANPDICTIDGNLLVDGENTLTFKVHNWAQNNGTQNSNPAGLLYKLTVESAGSCEQPPQCEEGESWNGEECVPDDEVPQCDEGEVWNGEECVPEDDEPQTFADACPNVEGFQDDVPQGYKIKDGECVKSGGGGSKKGRSGGGGGGNSNGEVQGAAACGPLLSQYLHEGWNNDKIEMYKLQAFLHAYLGNSLALTGFFDKDTFSAVENFQVQHGADVLNPWVGFPGSGIEGPTTPTGFVYQTTRWQINNIFCPGSEAFPDTLI